jgi:PAS domain S-box-containing protein
LEYGGKVYGLLSASIPEKIITEAEELSLFEEASGDIAFALHTLELEKKRGQAEKALQQEKEKFRLLVEKSPMGFSLIGEDNQYRYINPKFIDMFGFRLEDIPTGQEWFRKAYPDHEYRRRVISTWINDLEDARTEPRSRTFNVTCKDGSEKVIHFRAVKMETGGHFLIYEDMTDTERLEAQLLESMKMEAIGILAGGIAHEFNNALEGVTGNIELLQMSLPEDGMVKNYADSMKISTRRMVNLTNQLLAYAGGGKYQSKIVSLNNFVKETLPILQHGIDSSIYVEMNLSEDALYVKADLTQMQMVLSAILINASEAIDGKGKIRLSTKLVNIEEGFLKTNPGSKLGPHICIVIDDDGRGMNEATQSKIFEPFFTTKFQGRGLGMASVYGIVKHHDGWISIDSKIGKGTEVRIYLPAVESWTKKPEDPRPEVVKGSGTILVIEDEDPVMTVTRTLVEKLGYHVLEAKTGQEALEFARNFEGDIDLTLLDIGLPDMEGGQVYALIKEIRTDLKVIVCSGFNLDGPTQEILDSGADGFIQKPYSLQTLSEKLKDALS